MWPDCRMEDCSEFTRQPQRGVFRGRNRLRILARSRPRWIQGIVLSVSLSLVAQGEESGTRHGVNPRPSPERHGRLPRERPVLRKSHHFLSDRQTRNFEALPKAPKFPMPITYAYILLTGRWIV